jgi:hypothetical protein
VGALAWAAHGPYIGLASADRSAHEVASASIGSRQAFAVPAADVWAGLQACFEFAAGFRACSAFAVVATEDSVHPQK